MSEEMVIPDLESSPGIVEKRLPRQIERAIHNAMFIAQHIDNKDDFESEIGPAGTVTCTFNCIRYESLLLNHVIPAFQQRACVCSTVSMQDASPSHIVNPVKRLFSMHFGNDRNISRHFPTNGRQDHLILILVISD
ncbi:hypothetical protein AVEN_34177-1 [Araneus ventricosus]|uniref:Uncharacterized protein n=1 Tax=Araneus ventricosus TaxID=182803 RepID=A0A4Y2T7G6_ARAVE|nr:hypothetical protein AVEN_34177-1 [Araneus ventricosus]